MSVRLRSAVAGCGGHDEQLCGMAEKRTSPFALRGRQSPATDTPRGSSHRFAAYELTLRALDLVDRTIHFRQARRRILVLGLFIQFQTYC